MTSIELERAKVCAQRYPEARLVVVFGSVARGPMRSDSDVDIGISGMELWRGLELGAELGKVFQREPHVVDLDAASDLLRFEVARHGVLVTGEVDAWVRFRAEAALRYFDLAPIIARCAEGVRRRLARESGE